jgi:hypothetical protein
MSLSVSVPDPGLELLAPVAAAYIPPPQPSPAAAAAPQPAEPDRGSAAYLSDDDPRRNPDGSASQCLAAALQVRALDASWVVGLRV